MPTEKILVSLLSHLTTDRHAQKRRSCRSSFGGSQPCSRCKLLPLPHPLLLFRRSGTYEQLVVPNLQMTSFELGHCMVTKKYTLARKQLHLCTLCFLFALLLGTHSFFSKHVYTCTFDSYGYFLTRREKLTYFVITSGPSQPWCSCRCCHSHLRLGQAQHL